MRKTLLSIASLAFVTATVVSCGELTGPESPTTPTGVVATLASATSVNVSWTPSPLNDGVISYSIYRNGNKVGETVGTETTYTDTGLSPQVTYVYSVAANCVGGVNSARSVETAASTVTTTDITPPTVIGAQTTPPPGSSQISLVADLTVTFSEPMDPTTINTSTMTLRITNGAAIPGVVTYNAATRTATFNPTNSLPNFSSMTATVTTGAKDLAGNALQSAYTWTFTTRDEIPPTIIATSPANGATGVSPTAVITITFSEPMDAATINASNITLRTTSGTAVTSTVAYNANTRVATLTLSAPPLAQNVNYTVAVGAGVRDAQGNAMTATSFSFTTGDITAPTVVSTVPTDGAMAVAVNTTIRVTFSEPMDVTTITNQNITLRNAATTVPVAGAVGYDSASRVATFTPTSALSNLTEYRLTVSTAVKDASGNQLALPFISTFTTVAAADNTAPTIVSRTPTNGATGIAVDTVVRITFSEPMDQTTVNATNIVLRHTVTNGQVAASVTYNPATNTATLDPTTNLGNDSSYTIVVTANVKDVAGNVVAGTVAQPLITTFTTIPDTIKPTVVSSTPTATTGVQASTNITFVFSERMKAASINGTTVTLTQITGAGSPVSVAGAVSYDDATRTATLNPSSDLVAGARYRASVTTGATDRADNPLVGAFSFEFTVVAP